MSLMSSICLSLDSQISVNERLTRVVYRSVSMSRYLCPSCNASTFRWRRLRISYQKGVVTLSLSLLFLSLFLSFHFTSLSFHPCLSILPSVSFSFSFRSPHCTAGFNTCLDVRLYIWFFVDVRSFVAEFIILYSFCCLSVRSACVCQRDKQQRLACRNRRPLTVIPVLFNCIYIAKNLVLTNIRRQPGRSQVRTDNHRSNRFNRFDVLWRLIFIIIQDSSIDQNRSWYLNMLRTRWFSLHKMILTHCLLSTFALL